MIYIQQYRITGDILHTQANSTFSMVRGKDSIVDGTLFANWEIPRSILAQGSMLPLIASASDISDHALKFVPSIQVSSFEGHMFSETLEMIK